MSVSPLRARRHPCAAAALLAVSAFSHPAVCLAATPAPGAGRDGGIVREARGDALAVGELVREARALPVGGRLTVTGVQLGAGAALDALDLDRFAVFAPATRVVVHGDDGAEERPAPANAYFRGRVAGDARSRVLLTVRQGGGVRGLIESEGRVWTLENAESPASPSGEELVARRAGAAGETAGTEKGWECGNEGLSLEPPESFLSALAESPQATTTPHTARVAVETDFELYQKFGNVDDAVDYVGDLVAYSSTIYDAELLTDLQVVYVSLWTTSADPWTQTSTLCGLFEFGRWWNDSNAGVGRTVAHMMSGKNNGGGVAWNGVLCSGGFDYNHGGACPELSPQIDNYGGAYGYSGDLDGNFDPASPSIVWDLMVVSHEIGHNFRSPHTHCYNGLGGSTQPVDQCYNGEAANGCYAGSTSLPAGCSPGGGCATLMSYCHLRTGGLANIALSFGRGFAYGVLPDRVPDRMRAHVESRYALVPACLARIEPCTENLVLSDQTITGTETYEVCGTITAHDGFVVGNGGDVTLLAGERVELGAGFSVAADGRLVVGGP